MHLLQWTLQLLFPSRCLRTSRVRNCRDDGGEDVDAFAKHRHVNELVVIMQQDRGVVHGREAKRGVCVVGKAGHRQGSNSYQTSTEGTEGIAEKCSTALKHNKHRRTAGDSKVTTVGGGRKDAMLNRDAPTDAARENTDIESPLHPTRALPSVSPHTTR